MFFREVVMECPSPADLLGFYGSALGLPVVADNADEAAVRAGATVLRFRRACEGRPTYHFALRAPGNQFAEAKAWLARSAELVRDDGQDEFDWRFWGARAVYAYDPAGNVVEVMSFPDLDPPADAPFTGDSLLGIAELGLPVADPHDAVGRLADAFGIGLWEADDVSADGLTPVGEQGATFLVVPIGRTWLFGGPATDHPLDVLLGGVRDAELEFGEHPYRIAGNAG